VKFQTESDPLCFRPTEDASETVPFPQIAAIFLICENLKKFLAHLHFADGLAGCGGGGMGDGNDDL
jgi:hypothetical protein